MACDGKILSEMDPRLPGHSSILQGLVTSKQKDCPAQVIAWLLCEHLWPLNK